VRLIDADELTNRLTKRIASGMPTYNAGIIDAEDVIVEMPTIDAVQVVRCKDCEFYEREQDEAWGLCRCNGAGMPPMGFCSDGERKGEKNETN